MIQSSDSVLVNPCGPIEARMSPPGSKSITNRALVCAALASGESTLRGALDSDDTQVMIEAWKSLGVELEHDTESQIIQIAGCDGKFPKSEADIFVGNSGTTIRFLTAALAACHGNFRLSGVPRMHERPIGDLVNALRQWGADVTTENEQNPDCPPLRAYASGLLGSRVPIQGNISSQYLSGLMMAAPMAAGDVTLEVVGELVSVPYVKMTAAVMESFGAKIELDLPRIGVVSNNRYQGTDYCIEPDASAASYFWAAAAIAGGSATVTGLSRDSLQGDVGICEVLRLMGCEVEYEANQVTVTSGDSLRGVDVDMADISDTVQTLAAVAMFADGPTTVRGVAHNRLKETDRIGDLARELRKLGAKVDERKDGMTIVPPDQIHAATIETYDDHRMAMSLALVGLKAEGVEILNPACTAKTYPNYWEDLAAATGCGIAWGY
ncbi:MAG: 3-phosphoshikimate 1-carboxyvinyltransferase [Planctomycetota bacterium]|nr:3-phosphoshikimate 1-carboxyvinyltransferase [Planctomycetota bacterium]